MSSPTPHSAGAHAHHDLATGNHEPDEVDFGGTIKTGVVLTVVTVASYLIVLVIYWGLESRHAANMPPAVFPLAEGLGDRQPPAPRLQTQPKEELKELRAKQADTLEHYEWVDKNAGVVRLPIERAIELTVERGQPARTASAGEVPGAAPAAPAAAAAPTTPAAPPAAAASQEHR